jgi:hypothetical protein
VMALTTPEFAAADAARVAESYRLRFGQSPDVLHALTGPGATLVSEPPPGVDTE